VEEKGEFIVSKLKKVPKFKSEKEELEFWSTHDSADYIDYSKTKRALLKSHLKTPSCGRG
jgi:CopG antitoxin of type II toxin-antitoxin system